MTQKLSSKKKRIQRGLLKNQLCRSTDRIGAANGAEKNKSLLISESAQRCWSYLARVCCALNLIPLQLSGDGSWLLCSYKRHFSHYILVVVGLGLLTRNLVVSIYLLAHRGADPVTISCLAVLMLSFVSTSAILESSWSTPEVKDVMNSWRSSLDFIQDETGKKVSCFDSTADNLKVIGCTCIYHVVVLEISLLSLIFGDVPATFFGTLKGLGIIKDSSVISGFIWQLVLFPLEFLLVLSQAYAAEFNVTAGAIGTGVIRLYCNQMR